MKLKVIQTRSACHCLQEISFTHWKTCFQTSFGALVTNVALGRVVQKLINANLRLNVNRGFRLAC